MVIKLRVEAEVNGKLYHMEAFPYTENEKVEQIDSCKRKIKQMLDEEGLIDVCPNYIISKIKE